MKRLKWCYLVLAAFSGLHLSAIMLYYSNRPQTPLRTRDVAMDVWEETAGIAKELHKLTPTKAAINFSIHEETTLHNLSATRTEQVAAPSPHLQLCPHLPDYVLEEDKMGDEFRVFHRELMKYAQYHRQSLAQMSAPLRTLTWSCWDNKLCHGVGDQFYMIELAFLLAVVSNRLFFIHWDQVSMRTMQYLKPNMIDWSGLGEDIVKMRSEATTKTRAQIDAKFFDMLYSNASTNNDIIVGIEVPVPLHRGLKAIINQHEMTGALLKTAGVVFTNSALRLVQSVMFRYLFTFQDEVLRRVERIQREMGLVRPYISTHLRTGFLGNKYQEIKSKNRKFNSFKINRDEGQWNRTLKCTVARADSLLGTESVVFLASDSYIVKELARTLFPERIITLDVELQHVIMADTGGNPALNVTSLRSFEKRQEGVRSEMIDGEIGTWVDFLLLARSYAIVVPFSGFSVLASNVCAIPNDRVFDFTKCSRIYALPTP